MTLTGKSAPLLSSVQHQYEVCLDAGDGDKGISPPGDSA